MGSAPAAEQTAASHPGFQRSISGFHATLLVVGSVVGTGILATPALVRSSVPSVWLCLLLWALGGLYAMAGALSQARLAVRFPNAGGDYVYLRQCVGPLPAFLSGWISITLGFAGSAAALARSAAQYAWPALGAAAPSPTAEALAAILLLAAFTALNLRGVSASTRVQSALTAFKVLALAALAVTALLSSSYQASPHASSAQAPLAGAILAVIFTYTGWNDSIYVAGEISSPSRNLPLSLIAGTAAVTALYALFNFAYLTRSPAAVGSSDLAAATSLASSFLGPGATRAVASLAATVILGCLAAVMVTGPRIAYAMAQDGMALKALGRMSHRSVPSSAILFQSAVALAFVAAGSLQQIISWVAFAIVVFSGLATACVFHPLVRSANLQYRIPLYPWPPLIYVATSAALAVYVVVSDPKGAAGGAALVLAGCALYPLAARSRKPASTTTLTSTPSDDRQIDP
jgi:APA family basic amino acid/polyamine antiporter